MEICIKTLPFHQRINIIYRNIIDLLTQLYTVQLQDFRQGFESEF